MIFVLKTPSRNSVKTYSYAITTMAVTDHGTDGQYSASPGRVRQRPLLGDTTPQLPGSLTPGTAVMSTTSGEAIA